MKPAPLIDGQDTRHIDGVREWWRDLTPIAIEVAKERRHRFDCPIEPHEVRWCVVDDRGRLHSVRDSFRTRTDPRIPFARARAIETLKSMCGYRH